ncbi:MAG: molybdate ABC transporter substrate-binding protein [Gemmobacter sp.]
MSTTRRALLGSALAAALALPSAAMADEVTVFAAASLLNALDEIAATWQERTGDTITISYAGSSALARQIEEGAPADIFISAAVNWMDVLENGGHIKPETRHDLLGNTVVLLGHGSDGEPVEINADLDLAGMIGDGHLAMGMVDSVPAGQYGKAALTSLGLWDSVEPKVAQVDNVRAALLLVSNGEAPYGIVYATDAVAGDNVTVLGTFPAGSHDPVIYPAAITASSENPAAVAFFEALTEDFAIEAFEGQGFTVLAQ